MSVNRFALVGAAIAVGAGLVLGGAALGNAATTSFSASRGAGSGAAGDAQQGGGPDGRPGGQHTSVTGDELAKVKAAVTVKDSAVTVTTVLKDPDGSYDVDATKAGTPVRYEVSADLKTITEGRGGRGHGPGGPMGSKDTPVTGDELVKVKAAVAAKDSGVSVTGVRKDPDGSYDVDGTKAGTPVRFEVSADLKTITQDTHSGRGRDGGPGRGGRGMGGPAGPGRAPSSSASA